MIAGMLGVALLIVGCGQSVSLPSARGPAPIMTAPYRVHPGDTLEVRFEYHPDDNRQVVVGTDGRMALPVTGGMQVAGMTLREVAELVETRSVRFLREPVVSVTIGQSQARAYVGGEVVSPGFVSLVRPRTALQAVLERGGFAPGADLSEVVVLSHSGARPVARRLDLTAKPDYRRAGDMVLAADEVVLVPKTGIAKANEWVSQWLNGMTPTALRSIRFGTIDVFGSNR